MNITEKTKFGDGEVTLKFLDAEEVMPFLKNVSSVHCFPIKEDEVLFTVNPRGIDIIGGHVEKGETIIEALLRESMEEACIVPKEYKIIGGIEVDNTNNPKALEKGYPLKGIQLFYAVTKYVTKPFAATHECTDRVYVKSDDIWDKHHNWLKTHQAALDAAFGRLKPTKTMKM